MHVKFASLTAVFITALFAQPAVTRHTVPPATAIITSHSYSNEERLLLLEQQQTEQDNDRGQINERLTTFIDAVSKVETAQNEHIAQLDARLDLVYRFGALIAFVLTLSVPIFIWILNKSQKHTDHIATSISNLAQDVQTIKVICNIRNKRGIKTPEEEEDLIGCI